MDFRRKLNLASPLSLLLGVVFLTPDPSLALEKRGALEGTGGRREAARKPVPPSAWKSLSQGEPRDLIVEFTEGPIQRQAAILRSDAGLASDSAEILEWKAARYAALKQGVLASLPSDEVETLYDYSHLPMAFLRLRSAAALARLLERPDVVAIYEDRKLRKLLTQSLPLIGQPAAAAAGHRGAGTTVAVLDGGVEYGRAAFGFCTSPGVPAECKVVHYEDFADPDGRLDDPDLHGTNVCGIVVGVAPDSRIAALDVFNNDSTNDSIVLRAVNWCIQNKTAFNIAAMNLSLGGTGSSIPCSSSPYTTPFANARQAGIAPVVASGNDGLTNQLSNPACAPGAVSVGAVYDSNVGSVSGSCQDPTTAADRVTCFSNSASFLTMLAPGAFINAAGVSHAGTSQAAPHVAGAVAVLKSSFPSESVAQTIARLTSTGVSVTDHRNGIVKPRVNLQAATGAPAPPACGAEFFTCPANISGSLTSSDCTSGQRSSGQFTDAYEFNGVSGQVVTIDMTSSALDTYLILVSPSGAIAAQHDDISPTDTNSRIVFTLNATGAWRVEATSFDPAETGAYTLSVTGCSGGTPSVCTPGPTTLCLSGGRFRVESVWRKPDGTTGAGMAGALTPDTGHFWFFNPENIEMIVKVLNVCGSNRFWVFAGGLTNVSVTVTVTDTRTGAVRTYVNPQSTAFQPIQDTSAFATCP